MELAIRHWTHTPRLLQHCARVISKVHDRWRARRQARRDQKALAHLSERLLRDIGLEHMSARRTPPWPPIGY